MSKTDTGGVCYNAGSIFQPETLAAVERYYGMRGSVTRRVPWEKLDRDDWSTCFTKRLLCIFGLYVWSKSRRWNNVAMEDGTD